MMKKVLFPRANAVRSLGWLEGEGGFLIIRWTSCHYSCPPLTSPSYKSNERQPISRKGKGGQGENKRDFHSVRCPSVFEKKSFELNHH